MCNWSKNCKKRDTCESESTCVRNIKLSKLCDLAFLSNKQRIPVALKLDSNEIVNSFDTLSGYMKTVEDRVDSGDDLLIWSNRTGNGKTSWAIKIMLNYFNKIWYKCDLIPQAMFISVPRYFTELKNTFGGEYSEYIESIKSNIMSANLVVFDDISTKSATEFEMDNLFYLIDTRINLGKTNIYTSNVSPKEFDKYLGPRIASRVNGAISVQLNGLDKRGGII